MNKKRILLLLVVLAIVASMVTFAFAAPATDAADGANAPAVTDAASGDPAAADGEPLPWYAGIAQFLPLILIVAVFYFVLIRPENKRKKETANMRNNLKVGDEITTIGGILGKITNIKDEELTIETGVDRNKVRIMKWAISSVAPKADKEEKKESDSSSKEK